MIRQPVVLTLLLLLAQVLPAQGLFRDTVPLQVTIVTELKALLRDRDTTKFVPHAAVVSYRDAAGVDIKFPATLRTRGHFRRQLKNCDFPPLKLEFKRDSVKQLLFQGNSTLKITTSCRPSVAEYEQYVLGEYALYRAYQLISPTYFRTRLARITYHDSARQMDDVVSWAFFVEDDKEVAKKFALSTDDARGALFADLDETQLAITSLFEFMVANTDWSVSGLHNVALMRDSTQNFHIVAYDFDWSGAVNPRYAVPDYRLNLRSVTQRLYRGPCKPLESWQPIFDRFIAARPKVEAIYASLPGLDPRRARTTLAYLADFYQLIGEPKAARRAITDGCQPRGN